MILVQTAELHPADGHRQSKFKAAYKGFVMVSGELDMPRVELEETGIGKAEACSNVVSLPSAHTQAGSMIPYIRKPQR
jgi:hypothetical protein